MSTYLWKYYLEDDVESFCNLLAASASGLQPTGQRIAQRSSSLGFNAGELGSHGQPQSPASNRKGSSSGKLRPTEILTGGRQDVSSLTLRREDVNRRDSKGLTLLHHVASSNAPNGKDFARALLGHPHVDLYLQDLESGWTPLHRAFYFGNITIARAIIDLDSATSVTQYGPAGSTSVRTLIKIKDKEGLGPYDLLAATITDRTLRQHQDVRSDDEDASSSDAEESEIVASSSRLHIDNDGAPLVSPLHNINGDELYTFGSNRNISLGFGDEDDRHFPERISLRRPEHLFQQFFREAAEGKIAEFESNNASYADGLRASALARENSSKLPAVIRARPVIIQDVQMAKFSTAVLTTDPVANLYICGHGPGGRLGFGDEKTQFHFACLTEGGFDRKKIIAIALGQDHALAVTELGELYTWGNNLHGQLGTGLPKNTTKVEELMQLMPKRIFGVFKRDIILGVAASRIHSVAHTSTSVFTWGKNHGQLGLVDAQAGSLDIQPTPRKVAASRFSSPIQSVSANERATTCLLENHEVHVFANFGLVKLQFPLESFSNYFLKNSFRATKYNKTPNKICKITSGGDTICALSSAGEVFTVTVNQLFDPEASSTASTTHPNKIKAALSAPYRAWSLKKDDLAARDVGVDSDGSIILSTQAGSVWRRIRRPKTTVPNAAQQAFQRSKDFKFMRVPNLTRVVAVGASASGAYFAVRSDCNITREMECTTSGSLKQDIFALHPFQFLLSKSDEDLEVPVVKFWQRPSKLTNMINRISQAKDPDAILTEAFPSVPIKPLEGYDMFFGTTSSTVRIPLHQFLFAGRSNFGRQLLAKHSTATLSPLIADMTYDDKGVPTVVFNGLDPLSVFEIVFFLYTDAFISFWQNPRRLPHLAYRYRQLRLEIMKVASSLGLMTLESAVRRMFERAEPFVEKDFEIAITDPKYFVTGDAVVQLSDGEMRVHSALLVKRCPFFEGLFHGHARGLWLAERQETLSSTDKLVRIDLSHVEARIFRLVLRYIYADDGERMFDDLVTQDIEELQDVVLEVMSVANELMLDNLLKTCQAVLGRYVTTRNACQLLNAVAPSAVKDFKSYTLEYICRNLEPMLCNHHLEELDDDLLHELDETVRENQLQSLPIARSNYAFHKLLDKYPELVDIKERSRQAKLDVLHLRTRFANDKDRFATSLLESQMNTAITASTPRKTIQKSPSNVPAIGLPDLQESSQPCSPKASSSTKHLGNLELPYYSPEQINTSDSASIQDLATRSEARYSPPVQQTKPWASTNFVADKLNMKEIMHQASSMRTSNLSLGLQTAAGHEDKSPPPQQMKMSQKERKRQQQQSTISRPAQPDATSPSQGDSRSSPWKTVSSPKLRANANPTSSQPSPASQTDPAQPRAAITPQLTMRQTVANMPPRTKSDAPSHDQVQGRPELSMGSRSVSSPQVSARSFRQKTPESVAQQRQPSIRSIQHQPSPSARKSSTFIENQTLADIIDEEQAGKAAVKDAVAKRSLQEIQQEQEFQEWWDQESAAVQAAAKTSSSRSKDSGTSRGRRRGRGKGKEKEKTQDAVLQN